MTPLKVCDALMALARSTAELLQIVNFITVEYSALIIFNDLIYFKQDSISLMSIPFGYRPEIDGLRALAILPVILFHVNSSWLPGGFIGVDIFFVISGYLITGILIKEFNQSGSINFREFYSRRMKRILPLLALTLLMVWIISFLIMLPEDFARVAASGEYVIAFISNFYFGRKADYFAPASDEFPLLHSWSLSIEEQFYLFWPVFIFLLLRRKNLKLQMGLTISLCLVSFVYAHSLSLDQATATVSYFSTLSRIGELAIGGIAAFVVQNDLLGKVRSSTFLALLGLGSIFAGVFYITKESIFPGFLTLIPCLAAFLILVGTSEVPKKFLSQKILIEIGKHSYALYLFHWPIIAFLKYLNSGTPFTLNDYLLIVITTAACAVLSKKLIEDPIYRRKISFSSSVLVLLILPSLLFKTVFTLTRKGNGFPERISNISQFKQDTNFLPVGLCHSSRRADCDLIKGTSDKVLLFGDSHAAHYTPFWMEILKDSGLGLYARTIDSCPPLLIRNKAIDAKIEELAYPFCIEHLEKIKAKVAQENFSLVVISFSWCSKYSNSPDFSESIERTVSFLEENRKKVILMGSIPLKDKKLFAKYLRSNYAFLKNDERLDSIRKELIINKSCEIAVEKLNHEIERILKKHPEVIVMNPLLEDPEIKNSVPFLNKDVLYKDGTHLNAYSSKLLGKRLKQKMLKKVCEFADCTSQITANKKLEQ